jgi:hypothetical protein
MRVRAHFASKYLSILIPKFKIGVWPAAGVRRAAMAPLGVSLALLMTGCFFTPTAASSGTVTAEKFVLTDEFGAPRAELGIGPDGLPSLDLYDDVQRLRLKLGEMSDGTMGLILLDESGRDRARVSVGPDGEPSVYLYDKAGRRRSALKVGNDGVPSLILSDSTGTDRASLSITSDGVSGLKILDSRGNVRADLRVWKDDLSALVFLDSSGEPHASLAASSDGPPSLVLADEDTLSRVDLRVLEGGGGPSLVLTDRSGSVLFNLP